MTAARRKAEAAMWRELAQRYERAYDKDESTNGLCFYAGYTGPRHECIAMFDNGCGWYWPCHATEVVWGHPDATPYGRVLAACLLAAMAEAGDLDDIYDGTAEA